MHDHCPNCKDTAHYNVELEKENEELKAKELCTCDEINSRHCQYHQELADLQKENEELKSDLILSKAHAEIVSLRESLKGVIDFLESLADNVDVNYNEAQLCREQVAKIKAKNEGRL